MLVDRATVVPVLGGEVVSFRARSRDHIVRGRVLNMQVLQKNGGAKRSGVYRYPITAFHCNNSGKKFQSLLLPVPVDCAHAR